MSIADSNDEPRSIDWAGVAAATGAGQVAGSSSTGRALRALELLIGESNCLNAVDEYLSNATTSEFVRHVLSVVRPWSAMLHCHEVATADLPPSVRARAVELLRSFADRRTLVWAEDYLRDPEETVRFWAVLMVSSLIERQEVSREEALPVLQMAARHRSAKQLETVADVALRYFTVEEAAQLGLPIDRGE